MSLTSCLNKFDNPLANIFKYQLLSSEKCDEIIRKAENSNSWSQNRHKFYPTYDIPLSNIKNLDLSHEIENICKIGISNYNLSGTVQPFDLFVVKYDENGQTSLNIHRDSSELSFILLLSHPDDFVGGGTYYELYNQAFFPNKGEILFHCGKIRHAGLKISKGSRYILIGFLSVISNLIRAPSSEENKKLIHCTDQRYLDYLYKKNNIIKDIKIYIKIINLINRREKLERIIKDIENLEIPKTWKIDIQVIIADQGNDNQGYINWKTDKTYNCERHITQYWNRDITKGEVGCFLSHMKAINSINLKNNEYLLIFEDDASFLSDFLFRINDCLLNAMDWNILDLGGKKMDNKFDKLSNFQYSLGYVWQTHAILYNQKGLEILQNPNLSKHILPFDEFLSLLRKESPREDLYHLYKDYPKLNAIFPYQPMAYQFGNIHDTANLSVSQLSINGIFSRVKDDYDMINYYKFNQNNPKIDNLMAEANENMWKFQINSVIISKNDYSEDWHIYLTSSIKLIAVHLKNKDSSLTIQYNNKIFTQINDIIILPSYLSIKLFNVDLYFGLGSSFY